MVVLLNILIALFNSAYEAVTDNSIDEWMALFALKTSITPHSDKTRKLELIVINSAIRQGTR